MDSTIKNTFLLGCMLLAMVCAWMFSEITKSNQLIAAVTDPTVSFLRGENAAEIDFANHNSLFKEVDYGGESRVLGISKADLKGVNVDYSPLMILGCGTGNEVRLIGLDLESYSNNESYVWAYNNRLIDLLEENKLLEQTISRVHPETPEKNRIYID